MRLADEAAYFALEPGEEGGLEEARAVSWPLGSQAGVADLLGHRNVETDVAGRLDISQSIYGQICLTVVL